MSAWLSPFTLSSEHQAALSQAGWQHWNGTLQNLPSDGVVLYDTPDRLLALGTDVLQEGYEHLQDAALAPRAVALWRLLDPSAAFPEPEPVAGALALGLLSASPKLLEAYLDLELKADLRGGEPDVAYKRRLLGALNPEIVISHWQALRDPSEAIEAREEAELTLLQLHQVQEELEQVFLADRDKAAKLEELNKQLQDCTTELQEAREEAELTLLQLHQVQEELEHYFLLSRGQHHQLERYSQLQQRSQRLLAQLAQESSIPSRM